MKTPKLLCTALLVLLSLTAFGQFKAKLTSAQLSEAEPSRLLFASMVAGCGIADSLARADIDKQRPFLLLKGGIAAVVQVPTDSLVEQKFQFHYYDYGCSGPDEACVLGYNKRVFDYLTSRYGKKWMRAVRPDVVGLKNWKRAH